MKTSFQKQSLGGGYGINRDVSAENALYVAEPAMRGVSRNPGTNIMPGSPKTGYKIRPAKVISGKK